MELHDFRRQWQQQPMPDEPGVGPAALHDLLRQPGAGPVVRMQRNARAELLMLVLSLGVSVVGVLYSRVSGLRPFWLLLLATCLAMGPYYYAKLRILRQLQVGTNPLRHHVASQLGSLRGLLRLYYRITMLVLVVMIGYLLYWTYEKAPMVYQSPQRSLWLGLTLLVSALLTHWITKWMLQRLYGRNLDRLEAALHELRDENEV
ncbi:hypothetical protein [Hymenobacter metallicola]|uniref:Uncharacterized protein n=1 Tax=Hymenobacter metallicola TaxID=2563114 RepID=A0A4Z0Q150_9BACT|nr:hypothetical protein [Hymenobacter metallicola]TGE23209.1 hypothetical protein E5K02_18575 [Hymenobacter metallicola]